MSAGRRYRRQLRGGTIHEPPIPDDAPGHVKAGLAARAVTARTGRCPECRSTSVVATPPTPAAGGIGRVDFVHQDGCPAVHADVRRYPAAWMVTP